MRLGQRMVALTLLLTMWVIVLGAAASAGDWPQILGPHRNGIAADEILADRWASDGPAVRWSRAVGTGNAGVAVMGETGVLFHRRGNQEVIEAFDVETGEPQWEQSYATSFVPQVGDDDGPLCVPTIAQHVVVTFGAQGVLTCCDLATGEPLWQRKTHDEFEALPGYFGAGSSPLIWEDRVIVNVGGHKTNSGIVAFALKDGRMLWQATDERASYAAPVAATIDGQPTIVCVARLKCLGLNPADGSLRFELPFGRIGPTVNAAVPVVIEDKVFLTASYAIGAVWARLSASGAKELWRRRDVLASQYTTPIEFEGNLYAIDGREDGPPADLKCLDPQTGKTHWTVPRFGYATLVRGGDKLLVVKTDGQLLLVRPSPDGFQPLSRHQLTTNDTRALPALAGGCLYLRDSDRLYCVQVGRDRRGGER